MRYALVTGATSGIGIAISRVLARKGYGIVMVSSSQHHLVQASKSMRKRFPKTSIYTIKEDLSQKNSAKHLYSKIKEMGLVIDVLVNNAGKGLIGATEKIGISEDEGLLYLNMVTPTLLCKMFLKDMYKRKRGSILNVASTAAFQPGPYNSTYFASKAYIYSYSRAIRHEAASHGVRICTLCPGTTETKFFEKEGIKTPAWAMSAVKVAEYAIDGLERNKAVIIPGKTNKIFRIIPAEIKLMAVALLKKPKKAHSNSR
ncbi:MAG: SDR family NAD(P)-dependent oxidoreductase [Lachnospiraceae bacterium]|nr:SDR family NAD(P)-dependent oxidoreductase [Lachnospiraceae bacterium]